MKRLALTGVALWILHAGADQNRLLEHRNLGKAFYENATTKAEAVEEFRKALELAPDSLRDRVNYGLALLRAGKTEEGAAELEKVQQQDPSIPHTWFNLGVVYRRKGQYDNALAQFQQMLKLVPDEPVSHYNVGALYRQAERFEEALKEFQTAARLDPNFAAPRFQLYNVYRDLERPEDSQAALKDFQAVKARQAGPDQANEDTDWCYYAEIWEELAPAPVDTPAVPLKFDDHSLAGKVDARSSGLLVLDVDGDGRPDLLAWSRQGLRVYRNGSEPMDAGLDEWKGILSVAAGDFDNDGLADLGVTTESGPLLLKNIRGRFQKAAAGLPAGRFEKAVWLDYDHDYDLDLFLLGERSVLLRNQGAEGFRNRSAEFPFAAGHALDAVAFRLVPDSKAMDLLVTYRDHAAVLYRDRLLGIYERSPFDAVPAGAAGLQAVDFDNDSWLDLAYGSAGKVYRLLNRQGRYEPSAEAFPGGPFEFADLENRGLADLVTATAVYRNRGRNQFAQTEPRPAGSGPAIATDFNQDGRTDLAAVASDGSVHLLLNQTPTRNHWLRVELKGLKNLKLADGTEVEVKTGSSYQKKVYRGLPVEFGVHDYPQVDTVRITWPNGMIQNETRQASDRTVKVEEAPRLSGSCPMIFAWNGHAFEFVTDVLGVAPLGASSGDGQFFPVDHDEYVQLPAGSLVPRNGRYEIRITEELSEVSYLDQVRLIAADHPAATEIFTNDKWKNPPFPDFRLYGVEQRIYPRSARDGQGRDQLGRLLRRDRSYAGDFRRDYAGVAEMHSLDLDFGPSDNPKAVLVLNGWVDWADGSTFYAASQSGGLVPPYLQVKDAAGQWRTVIEGMGMPSGKTKTVAVDLTGKWLSRSRQVRIVTNLCIYWDEIFLGKDSSEPQVRLTALDADTADLRFRGFSRPVIHPQRLQPEYFDYTQVSAASLWNPTPGFYTRYGEVRELVAGVDDHLVVMGSGDELRLSFDAARLPALPQGWRRDFLLLVDGWAKDRDANTAYSQSVAPLPFHGMSRYPYPASEAHPPAAWEREYLTRPALRLIGPLAHSGTTRSRP